MGRECGCRHLVASISTDVVTSVPDMWSTVSLISSIPGHKCSKDVVTSIYVHQHAIDILTNIRKGYELGGLTI